VKTENFSRGITSALLALALVMSIVFVATRVSAGAFIGTNYSGQVIDVGQGGIFVLRTRLVWDESWSGYYGVTIVWEDNNRADENFTVLYTRAFFDNNGDNLPDPGVGWIENTTSLGSGTGTNGTRWYFSVFTTTGEPRNGYFDVEIYMQAGSMEIPHILTDNHPINKSGWGGEIDLVGSLLTIYPEVTTIRVVTWSGSATFRLENLYAVNLYKDLRLYDGKKLVVKFYTYDNLFENESVIHESFALPWRVVPENENVPHPLGRPVKKAVLALSGENTENVISIVGSFIVRRDDLWDRLIRIRSEWLYATPLGRDALWKELMGIRAQWPYTPS